MAAGRSDEHKMNLAPVALFVYNRPWHLQRTLEALQRNALATESALYIFSDGPRGPEQKDAVNKVRDYIRDISGFASVTIIERKENLGLAGSIIRGVTEIIERFGRIIVLEDDMVTSPYFLRFMNEALDFYENEDKIISIHGYMFPVKAVLPETFFLRGADCWGWATWKRGWELFETDGKKLLRGLQERALLSAFDLHGAYPYVSMLKDQVQGKNDSWAVRWRAAAFIADKLHLQCGRSLICNIGNDFSGRHGGETDMYGRDVSSSAITIEKIPIEEDRIAVKAIEEYLQSQRAVTPLSIIKRLFRRR